MDAALWGLLSALCLGSADFAGRFSGRALGAARALLGVLLVGTLVVGGVLFARGLTLPLSAAGLAWGAAHGVSVMLMTLCFYAALARGPVTVVAPIVASYPVLVLAFWVALGERPSTATWGAITLTLAGILLVTQTGTRQGSHGAADAANGFRATLALAATACLMHAVTVLAGQQAVPHIGEVQTLLVGRVVGLLSLLGLLLVRGGGMSLPLRWWPFLLLQGMLDAGGYLFLFLGSSGDSAVAAVACSTFGAVTTLLARLVLKERMRGWQWLGVGAVFSGVATLSLLTP